MKKMHNAGHSKPLKTIGIEWGGGGKIGDNPV